MARKKSSTSKHLSGVNGKFLHKGAGKKRGDLPPVETNAQQVAKSKQALSNAAKMRKIEAYAKANNMTIAQAMVHFMK